MKKSHFAFLLCVLLLCGCGTREEDLESTQAPVISETQASVAAGYYDPDSPLETETKGAVRCYPLHDLNGTSVMALGEDILVFSCTETSTTLTVLSGETLRPSATTEIGMVLNTASASLRTFKGGFSFFDQNAMETVVLDNSLREIRRIAAPDGISGQPLLSSDRSTLYYCTSDSIRALDLESGISRCLKEIASSYQGVTGLWLEDTVLECNISDGKNWQTMFLSTQTGQILGTSGDGLSFCASADRFYAAYPEGSVQVSLFGSPDEDAQALNPLGESSGCCFLPADNAAVAIRQTEDSQITLDYYDLDSGLRTASLTLTTGFYPWDFETVSDGQVCFLNYDETYGCNTLYCWDTTATPSGDNTVYIETYYTREDPDTEGLAECQAYAEAIGSRYGIEVLIHREAAAIAPYDYDIEYEHLVGVIQRELQLLERNLASYPEGFVNTLANRFDGLSICIVRSLTGTAEAGSLATADGIQFMDGNYAYIALAAGSDTEYALYHEMCHLIDTMVISETGAYDRWEELNPKGFAYDYDYIANQSRDGSAYLQEKSRSFIDTYSMSFPKEDRARIMEYAMTEGNEAYFRSTAMQSKLKLLCEGIREAFGLRKSPETFLWEQYLNTSLAYTA